MTRNRACALRLFLAIATVAQANPVFRSTPPAENPLAQAAIVLVALGLESMVVVQLAGRHKRRRDTMIWFCLTVATFLLFIAAPLSIAGTAIQGPLDAFSGPIPWLELGVVLVEAGMLWGLWLRTARDSPTKSLLRSVGISLAGNLVSYAISVAGLYAASAMAAG